MRPPAARLRREWRPAEREARQCAAGIGHFLTFATLSVAKSAPYCLLVLMACSSPQIFRKKSLSKEPDKVAWKVLNALH